VDYNPVNFRRLYWIRYDHGQAFAWRDLFALSLTSRQAALVRGAWHGYMKGMS
jgi:hypothetical protein